MSRLEDKRKAMAEQAMAEETAGYIAKIELEKRRSIGQGEFLGDMIGSVGEATNGTVGRIMVLGSQLTIILILGGFAAWGLISAAT